MVARMRRIFHILWRTLPYLIVFVGSLYHPRDPDLGWHLRYGEYFFTHGEILRANTFSQLMPDFLWVNSSWMTDLISYVAYQWSGFLGLALTSSLIVTLTAFFFSRWAKLTWWDEIFLFPLLMFLLEPVISVSFRGQLISFLFLGILFFLIGAYKQGKRITLVAIPPLFALWGNLHGQFFMGLVLFGLWMIVTAFVNRTIDRLLIATLAASAAFALINPFGIGVYEEALIHIRNPDLQLVAEYLPIDERSGIWRNHTLVTGILILGGTYLVFTDRWRHVLPEVSILLLLYGLSFWVRRYAWPFYWFSLFALQPLAAQLAPPNQKTRHISAGIIGVVILSSVVILKTPVSQFTSMSWESYCRLAFCSPNAAEALTMLDRGEKLFTTYDFGGWLIWNYRKILPTIDGRMHLWRDDSGYRAISFYWPIEQNLTDINDADYDMAFVSVRKPVADRLDELVEKNIWERLYKDDVTAIYRRVK